MPRGGFRPGAGRKKRKHDTDAQTDAFSQGPAAAGSDQKPRKRGARSPLKLLLDVVADESLALDVRMKAASVAVAFTHKKPSVLGKKEQLKEDARRIELGSRFGRRPEPGQNVYPIRKPKNSK